MRSVVDEAADAAVVTWSGDGFRLIPSRFPPVPVYQGLVANDRLDVLAELEALTNPRLKSEARLARTAKSAQNEHRLQNWNLAPFAYGNPEGSTFFGEERPCMELSGDRQTALAVAVARRESFLTRTSEAPTGLDMRLLKTPVSGSFWDLRPLGVISSRDLQLEIGARAAEEIDGILFCASERPSGVALSILNGACLGRSVQATHYRFVWDGTKISKLYAFDDKGTEIDAQRLKGGDDILAA